MRHNINNVIPGWDNPKQKQSTLAQIDKYALSMGFKPDEIKKMQDPRVINMAYKAMLLDQFHASVNTQKGK